MTRSAAPRPDPSRVTSVSLFSSVRRQKVFEGLALAAVLLGFAWVGWGHWGYCVISDYELDIADALRLFQGDVPYRDFLPTYGPLHMFLVAPLFHLGRAFFPVLWTLTLVLVFLQLFSLNHLGRRMFSGIWRMVLMGLAISAVAFAPTNSKFVMGYSQSGFLAVLLGTLALVLLGTGAPSRIRWGVSGICLGLIPFTKLDLGITSFAVVIALSLVWWRPFRSCVMSLLAAYAITWLTVCLMLALWAGRWDLLLSSTLETFGQVGLFTEPRLSWRIKGFFLAGLFLAMGLCIRRLRPCILWLERSLRPWIFLLLPSAILIDAVRSAIMGPVKQLVMINWLWTLVFVLVGAHVGSAVIRKRSLRPLQSGPSILLVALWVITGMGLLRVLGSGWYPLNYFQPAPLLLGIYGMAASRMRGKPALPRPALGLLLFSLLVQIGASFLGCRPTPYPLDWLSTPYGDIGFPLKPELKKTYQRALHRMGPINPHQFLLCTYEPSWFLLTGMRSAGLYTFFTRLGLTGARLPEREMQSLALIVQRRPVFIFQDHEVGKVHRHFGVDYGLSIADYIRKNYVEVEQSEGSIPYQRKDLLP